MHENGLLNALRIGSASLFRSGRFLQGAPLTVALTLALTLPITLLLPTGGLTTGPLTAAEAQAGGSAVQNVRVCDVYGRSVVVLWDPPAGVGSSAIGSYYLTWQGTGETTFASKMVNAEWGKPTAAQLQPLDPTKSYTVAIYPVDPLGNKGQAAVLTGIKPKGTYEAQLKAMTGSGKTGFLYLPENDPSMGRINPLKINNDFYHLHVGDGHGFDHSSAAVNNQQHWHMVANDTGVGSITSRIKSAISLTDGGTRHLLWDCDRGPSARQTWYIVLTPNKVETFTLFPNNGDAEQTNVWPREQIRIRFGINSATVTRYAMGNAVASTQFDWRQMSYFNVRQLMGMTINQNGLTFQADTDYNGVLTDRGSFATDLSGWKECYVYFTLGSYNNAKFNDVYGISATGKPQKEFAGGIMHWGNIAFDAPVGKPPATELSYFVEPDLLKRSSDKGWDVSQPLNLFIPNPIPGDAVSRELVFTDVIGCIPCLSGRDKLRLSVNGYILPNKVEDAVWAQYPTYRWNIPAGVLRQGNNVIGFGQTSTPDPISVRNVHVDIHVPPTSASVATYTPPPAHPVLDVMPNHTELEGWTIPELQLGLPKAPVSGTISLPLTATSQSTAHLSGTFVPFDTLWAEVDGTTVWSRNVNQQGLGSLNYSGNFSLDTTKLTDGYHTVLVKAHLKSGSQGYNNGSAIYSYDNWLRLLVKNGLPVKVAPILKNVKIFHQDDNTTTAIAAGSTYYVKRFHIYRLNFDVLSPGILWQVILYLKQSDGTWKPYANFNPAIPAATSLAKGGTLSSFTMTAQIWTWWPFDANGQDVWKIVAKDLDGNVVDYPFNWSLIIETPPPPVTPTAPPSISSFTADPLTINYGWSSQLSWSVSGADTVKIDNGIGSVAGGGKVCITPLKTTTYTLTAKNALGTTKQKVTVTVK